MDYAKVSEESLDEIMQKIRIENGIVNKKNNHSMVSDRICTPIFQDENYETIDKYLNEAVLGKQIGLNKAPMYKKRGLALKVSRVIEFVYLRMSQLITRDIRDFNAAIISLGHALKRKLTIIDDNEKHLQSSVIELSEEVNRLKSMLNQIKNDRQSQVCVLEQKIEEYLKNELLQRIEENKRKLDEYESKFIDFSADKFADALNNISETVSNMIKENNERLSIGEKSIDEKIALVIEKYNQDQILIRNLNEDIIKLKSIVKWVNSQEFTDTVKNKTGTETLLNPVFYHAFEEQFRGTRNDIKDRLTVYIPVLDKIFDDWSNKKFIDLGCGRGEWLDILRDKGVTNYVGVDVNEVQLNICNDYGHKTVNKDCIEYISTLPSESIDMITGFQLVEHLPVEVLFTLLNECNRVLKKDGVVLFETPNANNLVTGATYFYADPTHVHPLYKDSMKFFVKNSGFDKVEIIEVNPVRYSKTLIKPTCFDGNQIVWDQNIEILNNLLYGPQDYAVMGVK